MLHNAPPLNLIEIAKGLLTGFGVTGAVDRLRAQEMLPQSSDLDAHGRPLTDVPALQIAAAEHAQSVMVQYDDVCSSFQCDFATFGPFDNRDRHRSRDVCEFAHALPGPLLPLHGVCRAMSSRALWRPASNRAKSRMSASYQEETRLTAGILSLP